MSVPREVWLGLGLDCFGFGFLGVLVGEVGIDFDVCEQCMYLLFEKLISQDSLIRSFC